MKDCCRKCKYYMNKKELSGYCMWRGVHPQWVVNADKCCCPQYHNPEDEVRYEQD